MILSVASLPPLAACEVPTIPLALLAQPGDGGGGAGTGSPPGSDAAVTLASPTEFLLCTEWFSKALRRSKIAPNVSRKSGSELRPRRRALARGGGGGSAIALQPLVAPG